MWQKKVVIRRFKQGYDLQETSASGLLNASKSMPFWISFEHNIITIGSGTEVGNSVLLSFRDHHMLPVNYIGVSTGWGVTGEFEHTIFNEPCITKLKHKGNIQPLVEVLKIGMGIWLDRSSSLCSIPTEIRGGCMIRTACSDKKETASNFLEFRTLCECVVWVAMPPANTTPEWLKKDASLQDFRLEGKPESLVLWKMNSVVDGVVSLRGPAQSDVSASANYVIICVPLLREEDENSNTRTVINTFKNVKLIPNARSAFLGREWFNEKYIFEGRIDSFKLRSGREILSELRPSSPIMCCSKLSCVDKGLNACRKMLPCNHACYGFSGEITCLPCLEPQCRRDGEQTKEDTCAICMTDELQRAACISLDRCGHIFHKACIDQRVAAKWVAKRIDFEYLNCPLCKLQISHPNLIEVLKGPLKLKEQVTKLSMERFKFERLENHSYLINPKSPFYNKPEEFAVKHFAFYLCFRCHRPYFAGAAGCEAALDTEWHEADLLCGGCQLGVQNVSSCKKHGTDWLGWKCRFCCSNSVWYCFSSTHFCERCHSIFPTLVTAQGINLKKLHEYTQCGGLRDMMDRLIQDRSLSEIEREERMKKLVSDEKKCPLGVRHPPNGVEFGMGCILCVEKEGKKKRMISSESKAQGDHTWDISSASKGIIVENGNKLASLVVGFTDFQTIYSSKGVEKGEYFYALDLLLDKENADNHGVNLEFDCGVTNVSPEHQLFGHDNKPFFEIVKAKYGFGPQFIDVTECLRQLCVGSGLVLQPFKELNLTVLFGDPSPGREKKLVIDYRDGMYNTIKRFTVEEYRKRTSHCWPMLVLTLPLVYSMGHLLFFRTRRSDCYPS